MTAIILLLTCANFHNSAGQYERQFKKWGFRKNLTGEEWTTVSRRIDKRKRDGKETELRSGKRHWRGMVKARLWK